MSCYCTNSWDPQFEEGSHYPSANPYTSHYGAQLSRQHCSPSAGGFTFCVEGAGLGGIATVKYHGKTIGSTQLVWGQPLVMDVGTSIFGKRVSVTLTAMPHRTGCITNINASACLSTHCTGIKFPELCIGEYI